MFSFRVLHNIYFFVLILLRVTEIKFYNLITDVIFTVMFKDYFINIESNCSPSSVSTRTCKDNIIKLKTLNVFEEALIL